MNGRFRNQPCGCGSGQKFKNCCYLKVIKLIWEEMPTPQEVDYLKRQTKYFNKKYERITNVPTQ